MKRLILALAILTSALAANASNFFGDKQVLGFTAAEAISKGDSVSIAVNGDLQVFRNGDVLVGKAESDVSAGATISIGLVKPIQGREVTFTNGSDLVAFGVSTMADSSYDFKSADFTAQDALNDFHFSPDGKKIILLDESGSSDYIENKELYTPWDVSTVRWAGDNLDTLTISAQDVNMKGIFVSANGHDLYTVGAANDKVYQYDLATAWDVTTGTYTGNNFTVNGEDTGPLDLYFKDDGTKVYVVGPVADAVFEYTLSTPWNAATASYAGNSFAVNGQTTSPVNIMMTPNGDGAYVTGGSYIYSYALSTPWNASTASYTGNSFYPETDVAVADDGGLFINFAKDDCKAFMGVDAITDSIEQFSFVVDSFNSIQTPGVQYYITPSGKITNVSNLGAYKKYGFAFSNTELLLND
jgi:hypothetical protein